MSPGGVALVARQEFRMRLRTGLLEQGQPAAAVLLNGDPLVEPGVWRVPRAVVCDGRLVEPPEGAPDTLGS